MTKDELLDEVLDFLKDHEDVADAGRVDGEDAIGVSDTGGHEYFLTVQPA